MKKLRKTYVLWNLALFESTLHTLSIKRDILYVNSFEIRTLFNKDWEIVFPQMETLVTVNEIHQLITLPKIKKVVYHLTVLGVFLLVSWNPDIVPWKNER